MATQSQESALILLSGGQDSTTCLFWAKSRFAHVHAVGFDYGQRHRAELDAAREVSRIAEALSFTILDFGFLGALGDSSLTSEDRSLSDHGGYADEQMPEGLPTSFVPGRNLLFLSAAAAMAVKLGVSDLVTGVCQEDSSGYPDCREDFVKAAQEAVNLAMPSSTPLRIHTPLMHKTKAQAAVLARALGDDCWNALGKTVTCYRGLRPGCGECPSCVLRARGFKEANLVDPATQFTTIAGTWNISTSPLLGSSDREN